MNKLKASQKAEGFVIQGYPRDLEQTVQYNTMVGGQCSEVMHFVHFNNNNNNNNKRISRVPDQNGVSLLYIMLEIHHSGREPSISRAPFHVKHAQLH